MCRRVMSSYDRFIAACLVNMTQRQVVSIRRDEGRELVRDNILSFGNNPMNNGYVAKEGRYGKLAPIESDVNFYDSINQGLATMQPYQYISWST